MIKAKKVNLIMKHCSFLFISIFLVFISSCGGGSIKNILSVPDLDVAGSNRQFEKTSSKTVDGLKYDLGIEYATYTLGGTAAISVNITNVSDADKTLNISCNDYFEVQATTGSQVLADINTPSCQSSLGNITLAQNQNIEKKYVWNLKTNSSVNMDYGSYTLKATLMTQDRVSFTPVDYHILNIARKEIEVTDSAGNRGVVELSVWTDKPIYNGGDKIVYGYSIRNISDIELIFREPGCNYFEFFYLKTLEQGKTPVAPESELPGITCQAIYDFGLMPNDNKIYQASCGYGSCNILKPLVDMTDYAAVPPVGVRYSMGKHQFVYGIEHGVNNGQYVSVNYEVE